MNLVDAMGIDGDRFFIHPIESGEDALAVVDEAVRTLAFDVIVVDSVSASPSLVTRPLPSLCLTLYPNPPSVSRLP